MATLSLQRVSLAGTAVTLAAAGGSGDRMPVGPTNMLRVSNGSGASITVTVNSIKQCSQGFDHDLSVAVAAGATKDIGPITERFQDTDNLAGISYSATGSVTVAAVTV